MVGLYHYPPSSLIFYLKYQGYPHVLKAVPYNFSCQYLKPYLFFIENPWVSYQVQSEAPLLQPVQQLQRGLQLRRKIQQQSLLEVQAQALKYILPIILRISDATYCTVHSVRYTSYFYPKICFLQVFITGFPDQVANKLWNWQIWVIIFYHHFFS